MHSVDVPVGDFMVELMKRVKKARHHVGLDHWP